jgi:hypothetical protein
MEDYKKQYLKYCAKYLNLNKLQIGLNQEKNHIIINVH